MSHATLTPRASTAWLRWLPFLAWVGFVVCVFHPGSAAFSWVGRQPWGDKLTHFSLVGIAALLLDHALAGRRIALLRCQLPLAGLLIALGMTVEEVSQLWIPGRDFELGDLAANYAGIVAAGLASWGLRTHKATPDSPPRATGLASACPPLVYCPSVHNQASQGANHATRSVPL